jgi:ferredoxin
MKATVRYFSGTGNTWRIAAACAERFAALGYETDLESIHGENPPDPAADAACFCFPVHALDLPRNAFPYLRGIPAANKSVPTILLVTGGDPDNCGWALPSGIQFLSEKGYQVRIADLILMPNNWTPFHSGPEREEAARMIGQGVAKAMEVVAQFVNGETRIKPVSLRKFGPIGSVLMRTLFHKRGVYKLWMFFETGTRCNGCGLCTRICPTGSIRMEGKRPVWSGGCVQCMRCFNFCPNRAIRQLEPLLHGSRHNAYHLPGFNPMVEKQHSLHVSP